MDEESLLKDRSKHSWGSGVLPTPHRSPLKSLLSRRLVSMPTARHEELTLLINDVPAGQDEGAKNSFLKEISMPESEARRYWMMVQLVATAYICAFLPIELAFQAVWVGPAFIVVVILDYLVDLCFVSDSALSAYSLRGEYLKSIWCVLDVLSVLPLDLFFWNPVWLHFALRCNRFLRLCNVPHYIFSVERFSKKATYVAMLKLAVALVLLANLFASAKIGIS